jgi:7-keto-8-aminopelargonate synthetase-like enzyme
MLADELYETNILVVPIVFPMIASNKSQIRVQMSAKLNKELLDESSQKWKLLVKN